MRTLAEIYYDPKTGFASLNKLYKQAKLEGLSVTQKDVKEFMDKQHVQQVTTQQKRPKYFSSIIAEKIRSEYQMDIMVYNRYEYHKYKYIFVVVDIYSRYASARAMTNRENNTIMNCMKDIFNEMGLPKLISCDNEFATNEFEKYCDKHDINVRFSEPNDIQKNSIVERLNRTIAGYMSKSRVGLKVYNWVKVLPDIMENYNNSYHSTIRNEPSNIFLNGSKNKQDIMVVPNDFKDGDKVRIKLKKTIFDKGDFLSYSTDVFTIKGKNDSGSYILNNGKSYSAKHLKKIDDIIEKVPNLSNDEENEFNENIKHINLTKKNKKVGVNVNDILTSKRASKKKVISDV